MQRDFLQRRTRRAWREACEALGFQSVERMVIAGILAAFAVASVWGIRGPSEGWGELFPRVAFTIGVILVFPAVFAWKWLAAPAKMEGEAKAEAEQLRRQLERKGGVRLRLLGIRYEVTEMVANFEVLNAGEPTVIRNWNLKVFDQSREIGVATANFIWTGRMRADPIYQAIYEDLLLEPLESGGRREGYVVFTLSEEQRNEFERCGSRFRLTAEDVRGNIIEAEYTKP